MTLVLYEHPLSAFAQKIKLALYEKELAFEPRTIDLLAPLPPEFIQHSPRRQVPVLIDHDGAGELAVFDSTIILEYLEERFPERPLLPRSAVARARARMIEEVCDTYFDAVTWGLIEVRFFKRATGELAERLTARAAEQLSRLYGFLSRHLGAGPFFQGEEFGRADLSVFPFVAYADLHGLPPAAGTPLALWFQRVSARTSAHKTLAAAQAVLSQMPDLGPLVAAGVIRREYRDHRLEWFLRSGGGEIVTEGLARDTIHFSAEIQ